MTSQENSSTGSFWDHIKELRTKILSSLVAVLIGAGVAHFYYPDILRILLAPITGAKLTFLSILDPLLFIIKIDLFSGIVLASPLISWLAFSFIRPAMSEVRWRNLAALYVCSMLLAIGGLCYVYFIVIPLGLRFLTAIVIPGIENAITVQSYINFVLVQALITAIVFQMPLFIIAGVRMGILKIRVIAAKRRHIYLAGTIVLAMLTPTTDLFSLGVILLPAVLIFEGSLLLGRLFERNPITREV